MSTPFHSGFIAAADMLKTPSALKRQFLKVFGVIFLVLCQSLNLPSPLLVPFPVQTFKFYENKL